MKILRGTLTFVLGMIIGILLFVLAIGGTVVIIGTAMTVGDIQETFGFELFDKDSELSGKTILDTVKMVMEDVQQFDKLSIQTLIDKYGLPIPTEISGIDITEAFKYPIVELGDHINEIVNSVSLGEITTAFEIDLGTLPILTDNLDKGISDVINTVLASINGGMTLRSIKTNFGIDIGVEQNVLLKNMQDAPFENLGAIINGMRLDSLLNASTDSFVPSAINAIFKAVDVYEEVSSSDLANASYTAPLGVDTYIENGLDSDNDGTADSLLERELRFVKVELAGGEAKYNVDNSCYLDDFDPSANTKTYYRHVSYAPLSAGDTIDASSAYVQIFGNKVVAVDDDDYTLASKGFKKLADLASAGIAEFTPNTTSITVVGDEWGAIGTVENPITTSSKLDENGTGWILVEKGTSPAVLQSVSFLTVYELQNSSDFITSLKLGEVIDVDEASPQILQTLKDSSLGSIADDVSTLKLGEIIDIVEGESPGILVALKESTLDSISEDIDNVTLGDAIEITSESPQILISLQDTPIGELSTKMDSLKLGDAIKIVFDTFTEDANGIYAKVGEGENAYYTLYNEAIHHGTPRYARTPVTGSSSKLLQRFANVGINEFATAFDSLILGDVMDIDTDILQRVANADALLNTTNAYFYYDDATGLYRSASIDDITLNEGNKYDFVYSVSQKGTSSAMLKKLAFVKVNELSSAMEDVMDDMLLCDVMDITIDDYVVDANGIYTRVQDGASSYYTLYNAAIHGDGARYTKTSDTGSSRVLQRFANVSISQFATAFDELTLGDVLDINVDVYEKVDKAYAQANTDTNYYYYDSMGLYRLADSAYIEANDYVYKIAQEGSSSAMLKKLAFVKVNDLSTAMEDVMDDMLLGEVIEITPDTYTEDANGKYVRIQDGASSYYTLYNEAVHAGKERYAKTDVDGASSPVLQRLKDVSIGDFSTSFDSLTLGDVLDIDTDVYETVAKADALASPDEVYYYYDSATGLYRLADSTYINANDYVYKVSAVGDSASMLKKLAFVKINNLSTAMTDVIDDLLITDVLEVFTNYAVKASAIDDPSAYTENDTFLIAPYVENGVAVEEGGKKITYIYDAEGKYIQRDFKFVEASEGELGEVENMTYSCVAFNTMFASIDTSLGDTYVATQKLTLATSQLATGNAYYLDTKGTDDTSDDTYVYNVTLAAYLVSQGKYDKLYFRSTSTSYDATQASSNLYVLNAYGVCEAYNKTNVLHADTTYYKKLTGNFFVDKTDANYGYSDGELTFAKRYCEDVYVEYTGADDPAPQQWVHVGGDWIEYDSTNLSHTSATKYVKQTGYVTNLNSAYYLKENSYTSTLNPIKIDIVHDKSAGVLCLMAQEKIALSKINDAVDKATIGDLMDIAPDTIFDTTVGTGEDAMRLSDKKIEQLVSVFGDILGSATVGDVLNWGNISSVDAKVKNAIENITLANFFDSLTYSATAGIVVDMEKALGYGA